jgi:hypothetical protein
MARGGAQRRRGAHDLALMLAPFVLAQALKADAAMA